MSLGRKIIFTDYKEVNKDNIIEILQKAYNVHQENAAQMDFLLKYEEGEVNKLREKTYRKDIQNFVPDPLASYIVEFKLGFEWGNPITFVQSDDDDVEDNEELTKAISILNQGYRSEGIKTKQQKLARFIEVTGLGYTYTDINTEYQDGDSYFNVNVLDPRFAFVIRSNAYVDKRIIMGVSFRFDSERRKHFTCFTKNERYEIVDFINGIEYEELNPLGRIPIVEWIRSYDRQGCFEKLIPLIDDVTASLSALLDGVQSNTDVIWFSSDVEFPVQVIEHDDGTTEEVMVKPKDGDWLATETTKDGKSPKVQPLTVDYDYNGQLANIQATRDHILKLAHVPQRNDNNGGSTGVAMDDAAGWTDAEAEANRKQMLMDSAKMEELKVVLSAVRLSADIQSNNPLLALKYSDCAPNFKRSKQYELTVKTNAVSALISKGFCLEDILQNIALFDDPSQVCARSGDGVRRYQEMNVFMSNEKSEEENRPFPDVSDQQTNSPLIGGMSKEEAVEVE